MYKNKSRWSWWWWWRECVKCKFCYTIMGVFVPSLSLYLSLSPLSSRSPNFFSFVHFDFECFHFFLSSSLQSSIAMLSALCSLSISLKLAAFILTSSTKSLILISFHFIYLYVFRSCYFSLYDCLFLPLIISLYLYLIHATNFQNWTFLQNFVINRSFVLFSDTYSFISVSHLLLVPPLFFHTSRIS